MGTFTPLDTFRNFLGHPKPFNDRLYRVPHGQIGENND